MKRPWKKHDDRDHTGVPGVGSESSSLPEEWEVGEDGSLTIKDPSEETLFKVDANTWETTVHQSLNVSPGISVSEVVGNPPRVQLSGQDETERIVAFDDEGGPVAKVGIVGPS